MDGPGIFADSQRFLNRYPLGETKDWQAHFDIYQDLRKQFDAEVAKKAEQQVREKFQELNSLYTAQADEKITAMQAKITKKREAMKEKFETMKNDHKVAMLD